MPKKLENIVGLTSGILTVIKETAPKNLDSNKYTRRFVVCKCQCGNIIECSLKSIKSKARPRQSCGCLHKKALKEGLNKQHGKTNTRTYRIWKGLKQRCNNSNDPDFNNYGGRGITYCASWNSFEVFLKDMGECPDNCSIERLDVNKDYCKENCIWIPLKDQAYNKTSTKLSWDAVNDIRTYYKSCLTKKQCAEYASVKYDIGFYYVYKILNNKAWKV